MKPVAVVAMGAVAIAGAAARRRRNKRIEAELVRGEWEVGEFPSRDELEARRRSRRNRFTSGVEFSMGSIKARSWMGGGHH